MNRTEADHPIDDEVFAPAASDPEAPLNDVDTPAVPPGGGFEANEADALEQAQIVIVDDDESDGYM